MHVKGAVSLMLLVACGARTDLGGKHGAAGSDASTGDGGCAPEIVAKDPSGASALAVETTAAGDVVYWGTADGLVNVRDAGGTTTTLAKASSTITSIALDSTYVYYATTGTIARVPRAGGGSSDFVTNAGAPLALVISTSPSLGDDTLYWVTYGDGFASGAVEAKGQGGQTLELVTGLDAPGGLAVDNGYAYVASSFADVDQLAYQGPLFRLDKHGGSHALMTSNVGQPSSLVVYDQRLYYVEQVGPNGDLHGGVRALSIAGGSPTTALHTDGVLPLDVAVDASGVYATDFDQAKGSLVKAGADTQPIELASTPGALYGALRTTPTAIYWTIAWTGGAPADQASVRKLCK